MQNQSLPEAFSWPRSADPPKLTTTDARRVLHLTGQAVRNLVRAGTLVAERTLRGAYLFRQDDVLELAAVRAKAVLTLVKPRMLKARSQPRQLALFGLYRRRGQATRFRPPVYGLRSQSETAANRADNRRRVR